MSFDNQFQMEQCLDGKGTDQLQQALSQNLWQDLKNFKLDPPRLGSQLHLPEVHLDIPKLKLDPPKLDNNCAPHKTPDLRPEHTTRTLPEKSHSSIPLTGEKPKEAAKKDDDQLIKPSITENRLPGISVKGPVLNLGRLGQFKTTFKAGGMDEIPDAREKKSIVKPPYSPDADDD